MSADSLMLPTRFKLGFLYALLPVTLTGCGDIYRYLKSGKVGWHGEFDADDRQTFTPKNAIFRVEPTGTLRNGQPRFILRWRSDFRN